MIPIRFQVDDIEIRNIESSDFYGVLDCINNSTEDLNALGRNEKFTYDDIKMRYVETLVNSLEFFCGMYYREKIIGIIKGRIENKGTSGEVWILSYILEEDFRNQGIGTKVLLKFENYFIDKFAINTFNVLVMEKNLLGQTFWLRNGYCFKRITKSINDKNDNGMIILEKRRTNNNG